MQVEQCCQICGAVNQAGEVRCFACGRSFKATRPLPALDSDDEQPEALLLGRYRVQEQIGAGGFSAVYKALDTQGERVVAIKAVSLQGLRTREKIDATDAFNREVQFLSQLEHRSLPRVYEHFSSADCWYIVMDFIEGISLENYLEDAARRLTLDEVVELGLALCDVLEYLHTRSPTIIFRDLKPSNIMLTPGGRLYLIDFGIARHFVPGRKKDTIPFGSPGYAAPEQYGKAQTTPRSDIYSLGAVLHQLLTTTHPAQTPFQFAPIRQSNSAAPEKLEELIESMVDLYAEQRPESIAHVKEQLGGVVERRGVLPAVARSAPWATSVPVDQTALSSALTATIAGQQAQASVYYIPSSHVPMVSRRSLVSLWVLSSINFLFNFLLLFISCRIIMAFGGVARWAGDALLFLIRLTPLGIDILPLFNIIGLSCGCIAVYQARKVFSLQFAGPKARQVASGARVLNVCGLIIGFFFLAVWVLLLWIIIGFRG